MIGRLAPAPASLFGWPHQQAPEGPAFTRASRKKNTLGKGLVSLLLAAWLLGGSSQACGQGGPVVAMDDITFWVGSGSNRSALVIDWSDQSTTDPALAWGYRWDDNATGADMLTALAAVDRRLFAKLNQPTGNSSLLYGLGYDASGDGQFALDDGTWFDADGIAVSSSADGAHSIDPEDYYAEGWLTGLWHYGVNNSKLDSSNPYQDGAWISSPAGMAWRMLTDGSWDSWTFTQTFDFTAFAENPQAADEPVSSGDFNLDNDVDGTDFLAWQRGFGSDSNAALAQGDANGDGLVDGEDLNQWQMNFGSMANTTADAQTVPEPATVKLFIFILFQYFQKGKVS